MWICPVCSKFREWKKARRHKKLLKSFSKLPEFQGEKLDRLLTLVSSEDFLLFLEYLGLTVQEKLTILSRIDLLDDKKRIEAAKLQQQMQGLLMVFDIADYIQARYNLKEEDTNVQK